MKFGYKLMLSYTMLVIIPILIIGYYSYSSSIAALRDDKILNLGETLGQVQENVEYKQSEMERVAGQIYYNPLLQGTFYNYHEGWEGYTELDRHILPVINTALILPSYDVWLSIYSDNPNFPEVWNVPEGVNRRVVDKHASIYHLRRIEHEQWYKEYQEQKKRNIHQEGSGVWRQVGNDAKYGNISYIVELRHFDRWKEIGLIRVTTSLENIFSTLSEEKLAEENYLVAVDSQQKNRFEMGSATFKQNWQSMPSGYFSVEEELQSLSWKLVAYVPVASLSEEADRVRNVTILICTLVFAGLVAISWFIAQRFSTRVNRITAALRQFQIGDFQQRIPQKREDELADIEHAFNEMVVNIGKLIQEMYITKIKKKEAELNMLQAQINPHFLYNTLSAINHLARLGALETLEGMILNLAKFYRLSLSSGKHLISIDEEIQQVQSYLDIQKMKHGEDVEIRYEIEESILQYTTLKLLLQPFVENVLLHARFMGVIHIRIVAVREAERIVFKIIDDGIGIASDTLARLQNLAESQIGYGVRNVDQRIKLQYGDMYGVSIYSDFGIGTTVQITIPALAQGEEQVLTHPRQLSTQDLVAQAL